MIFKTQRTEKEEEYLIPRGTKYQYALWNKQVPMIKTWHMLTWTPGLEIY